MVSDEIELLYKHATVAQLEAPDSAARAALCAEIAKRCRVPADCIQLTSCAAAPTRRRGA
eukprot:SAG11_NODE_30629_length_299_cov_0.765000_1_plen_59_part_01